MSTVKGVSRLVLPFLVEGGRNGKNIFRVVQVSEGIPRQSIERLLQRLPIGFQLRKNFSTEAEDLNEALEVYADGVIISIYPPRHRVVVCTSFDSWKSADVVRNMHVDNVMDTECPGNGQLRTCVHFDQAILGIEDWPDPLAPRELEVDLYVFPKGTESERTPKTPSFDKRKLRELLELIAGGERHLTVEQLNKWRELIVYAMNSMRSSYENPDTPEHYPVRVYYRPCWAKIEAAEEDDQALVEALETLRSMIEWE